MPICSFKACLDCIVLFLLYHASLNNIYLYSHHGSFISISVAIIWSRKNGYNWWNSTIIPII